MSRCRPLTLLLAALVLACLLRPAALTATSQPPGAEPRTLRAAYALLVERTYRQPSAEPLLHESWLAALAAVQAAGYRGPLPVEPLWPSAPDAAWNAFAAAWPALVALLPSAASAERVERAALTAMAAAVPDGAARLGDAGLPASDQERWSGTGLGVRLSARTPWVVQERAPSSAAERADLRPGDQIVAVDGIDTAPLSRPALNRLLARPAGAALLLTVERPEAGRLHLELTTAPFAFPLLESAVVAEGVGYLRLRGFPRPGSGESLGERVEAAWARLRAGGATALLLDLRDNPGGDGYAMAEVAGRLLGDAPAYTLLDERGRRGVRAATGRPLPGAPPLAVLVNGGTAGLAEVLAASLQHAGRAQVAGVPTAGDAAHLLGFPLPGGELLSIAVAELRAGSGGPRIHGAGLTPDLAVADSRQPADYAAGRDPQRAAAVRAVAALAVPELPSSGSGYPLVTPAALREALGSYLPAATDIPGSDITPRGELLLLTPEQWVSWLGPAPAPAVLGGLVRTRGWQGGIVTTYAGGGMSLSVRLDWYRSQTGAHAALHADDAALTLRGAPPSPQAPEGALAYEGTWTAEGSSVLAFRSGGVVVTLTVTGVDTARSGEVLARVSAAVAARLQAMPAVGGAPLTPDGSAAR